MRDRRQRSAAPVAARLSADARDVAQDRAAPCRAIHRGVRGPARLRRFLETRRRRTQRQLFEARDGGGPGRGDAGARLLASSGSRVTIAADALPIASSSIIPAAVERVAVLDISPTRTMFGKTDQAFATAYYHWFFLIQPFDLPERLIGSDPDLLPAQENRRLGLGGEHLRPARVRRVRALLREARDDPCDVRGLSRGGVDRSRARRRRCRGGPQDRLSAARALGRQGRCPPLFRSGRRLAGGGERRARARAAVRTLPGRRSAGGDAGRVAANSSSPD